MQSDAELVDMVLNGNQDAFAVLIRRYEGAVRAVATQVLGDLHAAEDAAQEAFVKAYQNLGGLQKSSVFGGWLLKIARHQAITLARQRARHQGGRVTEEIPAHRGNGQLDEESKILLAAVMKLPQHERRVVMLRHFDGHTVRVIAGMTGRSISTVTKQLSRARQRLREALRDISP